MSDYEDDDVTQAQLDRYAEHAWEEDEKSREKYKKWKKRHPQYGNPASHYHESNLEKQVRNIWHW